MISREKWSPYRPLLCGRSTSARAGRGAARCLTTVGHRGDHAGFRLTGGPEVPREGR